MRKGNKDWSLEEVIDHIMRSTGCSRGVARKKLARHVKKRELTIKQERQTRPKPLPGSEAAEMLATDPESVMMPLGELMVVFDFTPAELLGELRSGRLVAGADETTLFALELNRPGALFDCTVTGSHLLRWLANPKTPPHLVAKMSEQRPIH